MLQLLKESCGFEVGAIVCGTITIFTSTKLTEFQFQFEQITEILPLIP